VRIGLPPPNGGRACRLALKTKCLFGINKFGVEMGS